MTPRPRKGPRLYIREQGGQLRYYADLRSVGRSRVALVAEGETQATTARVGWGSGDIRTKMFRHTYASDRLQTLDGGHPVSLYTVGKELGHGGTALVKKVYGHLGRIRHRSEHVEYRIEQQREVIPPERLRLLLRIA